MVEHASPDTTATHPAGPKLGRHRWRVLAVAGAALAAVGLAAFAVQSSQAMTSREFWFMVHLGLGVLTVHAFAGGLSTLLSAKTTRARDLVRTVSTAGMAGIAWLTVLSGTWIVYPGYRAEPVNPPADLSRYPMVRLEADPQLAFWHTFGMEWKEHIGWLTPFLATAVAFIVFRYARLVMTDRRIKRAVRTVFVTAFAAAVVAAALGGFINTVAPNNFLNVS